MEDGKAHYGFGLYELQNDLNNGKREPYDRNHLTEDMDLHRVFWPYVQIQTTCPMCQAYDRRNNSCRLELPQTFVATECPYIPGVSSYPDGNEWNRKTHPACNPDIRSMRPRIYVEYEAISGFPTRVEPEVPVVGNAINFSNQSRTKPTRLRRGRKIECQYLDRHHPSRVPATPGSMPVIHDETDCLSMARFLALKAQGHITEAELKQRDKRRAAQLISEMPRQPMAGFPPTFSW